MRASASSNKVRQRPEVMLSGLLHVGPVKKVGRFLGRPILGLPQPSARVGDALLGIRLSRGRWPRGQLKHCYRLIFAQGR